MRVTRQVVRVAVLGMLAVLVQAATAVAQAPFPEPDASGPPNIFYGATPPDPVQDSVLVFIHGLGGTANNWWLANDTYQRAYDAGYRTAFIGLSEDNTPNSDALGINGDKLKTWIPMVADHFGEAKVVIVGHSKGGVDAQAAMLAPLVRDRVKAVFTVATPNNGTELADWAFGPGLPIAAGLDMLSPGLFSLRTSNMAAFRSQLDPVLQASGIPFYTLEGTSFTGNPLTQVTGAILTKLVPDQKNDGLVTVARSRLPEEYATVVDAARLNHFKMNDGATIVPQVDGLVRALDLTLTELEKIEANGFGDKSNTWAWSMKWFQGKLYVGTGREITCMTTLTSDVQQGSNAYALAVRGGGCPDLNRLSDSLAAEIWRYDPATGDWQRVYRAPETIPLFPDADGNLIMSGRDIGYRGMTVFVEPDGTEALYVGTVTSGSVFEEMGLPQFAGGYPPPRILRTVDGMIWQPIPQAPGTFLGDIGKPDLTSNKTVRSIRSLTAYNGMLFATAGTFTGVGRVIASANPKLGNDAWFDASPSIDEFPVWDQKVYADRLYVTTGNKEETTNHGYGVFWTDATGPAPYVWHPVVENGGYQTDARYRSPSGLSMAVFNDQLYVGMNRPTELIRVNVNGTWDLLVGEPRMTPHGMKTPLTGLGIGFGSWFNGHFWRMAAHEGHLYLGTWDWSLGARLLGEIGDPLISHFGFDLYRTADGIHWEAMSRSGLGDKFNFGGRSIESTPEGLFLGTTRPQGGLEIFACPPPGCTATPPDTNPPAPTLLEAESEETAGRNAVLSWQPSPGASQYRVYRATVRSVADFLPGAAAPIVIPGLPQPVTREMIKSGELDFLCANPATQDACVLIDAIQTSGAEDAWVPERFELVAVVPGPPYIEPAPTQYSSLYFVRAEGPDGSVSKPSNFVGAPSKTAAVPLDLTPPEIVATLSAAPNEAGWHNGPVTVTWTVSDPDSNIISSSGCEDAYLDAETAGVTLTCAATNGNSLVAEQSVTIRIDTTAPVVTFGPPDPPANEAGWHNTDVSLPYVASDNLSGVLTVSAGPSPLLFTEDGIWSASVMVADAAGNIATYNSIEIKIDKTLPEAALRFDPATLQLAIFGVDELSGVPDGPFAATAVAPAPRGRDTRHSSGLRSEYDDEGNSRHGQQTFRIVDRAGNALTVTARVKQNRHEAKAELLTLQYGSAAAVRVPETRLHVEFVTGKQGQLRELRQQARLGKGRGRQQIEATFSLKKLHTSITEESEGGRRSRRILDGVQLVRLRTTSGSIVADVVPAD